MRETPQIQIYVYAQRVLVQSNRLKTLARLYHYATASVGAVLTLGAGV
jgi:hypothetical protein